MKNTVLSLLRSGALYEAEKEYKRLGLDQVADDEDTISLGGRILKSRALEQSGEARRTLALAAARKYNQAFEATDGTYSGINTAAMYVVAGDLPAAQMIANTILDKTRGYAPRPGEDAYYHMATVAEAHLILGDKAMAAAVFRDAIELDPNNYTARASTVRQFDMLIDAMSPYASACKSSQLNLSNQVNQSHQLNPSNQDDWLDVFRPPLAMHYAGHMFDVNTGTVGARADMEYGIDTFLDNDKVGFAYGSLAAGADIVIAEKILDAGAELHVILPCPNAFFIEASVRPFGEAWVERFEACLSAATSVRYTSFDAELPDDLGIAFASEVAMGLAVLHSERLATRVLQLLLWDGKVTGSKAGTARDARTWVETKRQQVILPFPFERRNASKLIVDRLQDSMSNGVMKARAMRGMLFTDVRGFSSLRDSQIPVFMERVLTPLADACRRGDEGISFLNTWGDGLFITTDTVGRAAKVALKLQEVFQAIPFEEYGLPDHLALRVGGHYGPVHELVDPFSGDNGVLGAQVTMAAKIEPVTAPGSVYVSETFACALAVQAPGDYVAEQMQDTICLHKSAQQVPLFNLRAKGYSGL